MGTLDVVLVPSPLAASNCCEDLPPRDAQAQTAQVLRLRPGRIRLTEYRFRSVERGCCQPRQRPSLLRPSMCQACRRIDVCFWRLAADVRTADMGRKAVRPYGLPHLPRSSSKMRDDQPPSPSSGCTGAPGKIFCRLPEMILSPSLMPFVSVTRSPSVGPKATTRCSTRLSLPTT